MLNLPFCWQQNVFSSLQSKSTFSYLFSFAFIQKQFSVISWGLICNQRKIDWVIKSLGVLSVPDHIYIQTQHPTAASTCLWNNPLRFFPKVYSMKYRFCRNLRFYLRKESFHSHIVGNLKLNEVKFLLHHPSQSL